MNRSNWMDQFGFGAGVTAIGTDTAASFAIPIIGHPSFESGSQTINQRKAIGQSYRRADAGFEYQQSANGIPSASFTFDVSKSNLCHCLWSLFQQGAFQRTSTPYLKYFFPYDIPDCDMWMSLVRKLAPAATLESHRILGAVAKQIQLVGKEGQPLQATVDFNGYSFSSARNIALDTLTYGTDAPLLFQNAAITLGGLAINIPEFIITISNNLITKFYDSATAIKHLLDDFTVVGNIKIPWADTNRGGNTILNNFVAGTIERLVISWGATVVDGLAVADGDFAIITHARMTSAQLTGDDELIMDVNFEGVCEESTSAFSTASASSVQIATTGAITGTNTVFDNLDGGDLIYVIGASADGDKSVRVLSTITNDTSAAGFPVFSANESGKIYHCKSTPICITVADAVNIAGM